MKEKNSGSAILMALIIILVIGGIGVAFIYWFSAEGRQSVQKDLYSKTISMGEAGVQRAIRGMNDPLPGTPGGDWLRNTWQAGFTTSFFIRMDGTPIQVDVEHLGTP